MTSKESRGVGLSLSKGVLVDWTSFSSGSASVSMLNRMTFSLGSLARPAARGAVPQYTWQPGILFKSAITNLVSI